MLASVGHFQQTSSDGLIPPLYFKPHPSGPKPTFTATVNSTEPIWLRKVGVFDQMKLLPLDSPLAAAWPRSRGGTCRWQRSDYGGRVKGDSNGRPPALGPLTRS